MNYKYITQLIQVLAGLGLSKVRIMTTMAIMAAYQIEEDMAGFLATYYGRSEELTSEAFMLKLEELSEKKNGNLVRTGKYYHHPEHYVKTSKVDE